MFVQLQIADGVTRDVSVTRGCGDAEAAVEDAAARRRTDAPRPVTDATARRRPRLNATMATGTESTNLRTYT